LHKTPEISGEEKRTSSIIIEELEKTQPDKMYKNIGGFGVIAVYDSGKTGPDVMLRAELDALPIYEESGKVYHSENEGKSHACGHDGHMAVILGVARYLKNNRPRAGKVLLLFQPSEETGEGAARLLNDPVFKEFQIDRSYAFHNLPGFSKNEVIIRDQTFASASVGLICRLKGESSHAAYPEQGRSPAPIIADIISYLDEVNVPDIESTSYAIGTITYAMIGEKAFGISPGSAEFGITFRAVSDQLLTGLKEKVIQRVDHYSKQLNIKVMKEEIEPFKATVNNEDCVNKVVKAAEKTGLEISIPEHPFPWSEDFGRFSDISNSALFGLGAGIENPHLHAGEYDFNDKLIKPAVQLFKEILNIEWEQD
jgi:amidohydrolase